MKQIILIISVLFGMLFADLSIADTRTFQFSRPILRINNDVLTIPEIVNYDIQCGTTAGGPYTHSSYAVPDSGPSTPDVQSFTSPDDFPAGTYFCRVGALTTDPDGGPTLQPAEFTLDLTFSIVACTAATCGAKAPTSWNSS